MDKFVDKSWGEFTLRLRSNPDDAELILKEYRYKLLQEVVRWHKSRYIEKVQREFEAFCNSLIEKPEFNQTEGGNSPFV